MTSLIEKVRELKELEAKATPGPWSWYAEDSSMSWLGQTDNDQVNFVLGTHVCKACAERNERCLQPRKEDAEIITSLRNAAPLLLDVLGMIQAGDAERLEYAVRYLESTNCPAQCIEAVRRCRDMAKEMEATR